MARLIPSFMDDATPPGERDVYNLLAAGPDDWVALHSLDLAPWNRGLRTEIDFVVIIPDAGLLCIEVKSHENIYFDGNRWHPESINRSPFKQASDGRYTFQRRLAKIAPQFRYIPIAHCCIFPRSTFELTPNLSVRSWELIDSRLFRGFNSGNAFCSELKMRMKQAIDADATLRPLLRGLSSNQINSIVAFCLPIQRRRPDKREEIRQREQELEGMLRKQQKPVLQLAEWNERLIVRGAAGTGKTLIAMEVARRASERGRRVALLCFNQLIGDWMRRQIVRIDPVLPTIIVGRAIRVMAEMTEVQIPPDPSQLFWEIQLPEMLEDRLTDPDLRAVAQFDYLVLDEAQDVLARPRLWQALIHFLAGGLDRGRFALFGDFDHQALADRERMSQNLLALNSISRPAHWSLTENCRNYRIVGETAVRLSGFGDVVYSGYMRTGGSIQNYDISFYENETAQLDKLARWIQELEAQGYKASEITLLSFRADHLSAAGSLRAQGYKLRPAWQSGEAISCASVHAFKGMENKLIILTDVDLEDRDFHRQLFYTGMTRATECVRVLCNRKSQATLMRWLSGKSENERTI